MITIQRAFLSLTARAEAPSLDPPCSLRCRGPSHYPPVGESSDCSSNSVMRSRLPVLLLLLLLMSELCEQPAEAEAGPEFCLDSGKLFPLRVSPYLSVKWRGAISALQSTRKLNYN